MQIFDTWTNGTILQKLLHLFIQIVKHRLFFFRCWVFDFTKSVNDFIIDFIQYTLCFLFMRLVPGIGFGLLIGFFGLFGLFGLFGFFGWNNGSWFICQIWYNGSRGNFAFHKWMKDFV